MLILTEMTRGIMIDALKVAHKKGMLNEIRNSFAILEMSQEEIFNYFIIVTARLIIEK